MKNEGEKCIYYLNFLYHKCTNSRKRGQHLTNGSHDLKPSEMGDLEQKLEYMLAGTFGGNIHLQYIRI